MKIIGISISILLGLLIVRIVGGWWYMKKIETVRVEPIEQKGVLTIGYFPAGTQIVVSREDGYNTALRSGFSELAEYIFGGNEKNESIAMTSPVVSAGDVTGEGEKQISFILPASYTAENSPMPNDPRIQIQDIGRQKVAAYTFRGVASANRVEKELTKFKRHLALQRVEHTGEFMLAQYEPPLYFPLLRTNQWIVPITTEVAEMGNKEDVLVKNEAQRSNPGYEIATFAAGCFWCSEAFFQEAKGVVDAVVGYAGGIEENPTYEEVSAKKTSHREAVQVLYDPIKITYNEILNIFWKSIDPTDAGGQFVDRGFQYTTVIFTHNQEQLRLAEESKQELEASGKYDQPIVTEILPYTTFYLAEDFHQDFYKHAKERYERYKNGSGRPEYYDEFGEPVEKEEEIELGDDFLGENMWQNFEKPSEDELREELTSMQFRVTQKDGTEPPFANAYDTNKEDGIYVDIVSGEPLYSSLDKYDSGTGWPSFVKPIHENAITLHTDTSLFQTRTEVRSVYADSHLGHVFTDGPAERGGLRYCMNSAAMEFIPLAEMEEKGYGDWMVLFEE